MPHGEEKLNESRPGLLHRLGFHPMAHQYEEDICLICHETCPCFDQSCTTRLWFWPSLREVLAITVSFTVIVAAVILR